MSRSRKKVSYFGDKARKKDKREASKAVRRYKENIPKGKWFRKIFDSWNIKDFYFLMDKTDKYYKKGLRK